jgi:hypothetical protein
MIDINDIKKEVEEQLKNCDTFFIKEKAILYEYIIKECEQLENKKYKYSVNPINRDDIKISITFDGRSIKKMIITKKKVEDFYKKEYFKEDDQ